MHPWAESFSFSLDTHHNERLVKKLANVVYARIFFARKLSLVPTSENLIYLNFFDKLQLLDDDSFCAHV